MKIYKLDIILKYIIFISIIYLILLSISILFPYRILSLSFIALFIVSIGMEFLIIISKSVLYFSYTKDSLIINSKVIPYKDIKSYCITDVDFNSKGKSGYFLRIMTTDEKKKIFLVNNINFKKEFDEFSKLNNINNKQLLLDYILNLSPIIILFYCFILIFGIGNYLISIIQKVF